MDSDQLLLLVGEVKGLKTKNSSRLAIDIDEK
jgi:hypothetical protein